MQFKKTLIVLLFLFLAFTSLLYITKTEYTNYNYKGDLLGAGVTEEDNGVDLTITEGGNTKLLIKYSAPTSGREGRVLSVHTLGDTIFIAILKPSKGTLQSFNVMNETIEIEGEYRRVVPVVI